MSDLNYIQMHILKELLFNPNSSFSKLNNLKISTDQFSYHLKVLIKAGLVDKDEAKYRLTKKGKEFANRMDTDAKVMEKQPKISVLIIPKKIVNGIEQLLVQTRLKEPYYGYMGFMTGKMRFGETVEEAAVRELYEEAGLTAKFRHKYVLHEMVYTKELELLEDKFFNVMEATDVKGEIVDGKGTKNQWMTEKEFYAATPKFHNEIEIYEWYKENDQSFKEEKYFIEEF